MKKIEIISQGNKYSAVDMGSFNELMQYTLTHPKTKQEIEGKVFLKNITGATGTEISLNMLPPATEVPYFHSHIQNEETYIILKGHGDFQIDEDCFPIKEGSVIRVATQAMRGLRNSSEDFMIYMVIQSKQDSLVQHTHNDGERGEFNPKWDR